MSLSNVAITDTFDVWRIRTNQIIVALNEFTDGNAFSTGTLTLTNPSAFKNNVTLNVHSGWIKGNGNGITFIKNTVIQGVITNSQLANANLNIISIHNSLTVANGQALLGSNVVTFNITNLSTDSSDQSISNIASASLANTNRQLARAAYDQANTGGTGAANAYGQANNAYNQANAAYNAANVASGGSTFFGNVKITNTWIDGQNFTGNTTEEFFTPIYASSANTNAGGGPYIVLDRSPSDSTSSNNDVGGFLQFKQIAANGQMQESGFVYSQLTNSKETNFTSQLVIGAKQGGVPQLTLYLSNGIKVGAVTGGYFGDGTINYITAYKSGVEQPDSATVYAAANTASDRANTGRGDANTASDRANTAYGAANTASGRANTAYGAANTASDRANTAYGQANTAYNQANNAYNAANNVSISYATKEEIWSGTSTKPATVANLQAALAAQTLANVAGILTVDFGKGINFTINIGRNLQLYSTNVSNCVGRSGTITFRQDATGNRNLDTTNAEFVSINGQDISLSGTANTEDDVHYRIRRAGVIELAMSRGLS